jgi:hypothetical protein
LPEKNPQNQPVLIKPKSRNFIRAAAHMASPVPEFDHDPQLREHYLFVSYALSPASGFHIEASAPPTSRFLKDRSALFRCAVQKPSSKKVRQPIETYCWTTKPRHVFPAISRSPLISRSSGYRAEARPQPPYFSSRSKALATYITGACP